MMSAQNKKEDKKKKKPQTLNDIDILFMQILNQDNTQYQDKAEL